MKKYTKYIIKGIPQDLSCMPFHSLSKAPVKRLLMLSKESLPRTNAYISLHLVKELPKKIKPYCEYHKHDFDEINLIISESKKLVYDVYLGDEVYKVSSNSSIYIPKGLKHKAEVSKGEGIFISILLNGKYKALK